MSKEKILHDGSRAMADVSRGLSSRRLSCVSREWVYNGHALCIFIYRINVTIQNPLEYDKQNRHACM